MSKLNWWAYALQFSVYELHISPKEFWQLSLPEFRSLASVKSDSARGDVLNRNAFDNLTKKHPDT